MALAALQKGEHVLYLRRGGARVGRGDRSIRSSASPLRPADEPAHRIKKEMPIVRWHRRLAAQPLEHLHRERREHLKSPPFSDAHTSGGGGGSGGGGLGGGGGEMQKPQP